MADTTFANEMIRAYNRISAACKTNSRKLQDYDFASYKKIFDILTNTKPRDSSSTPTDWDLLCNTYLHRTEAFSKRDLFVQLFRTNCDEVAKVQVTFCEFEVPESSDCHVTTPVMLPVKCPVDVGSPYEEEQIKGEQDIEEYESGEMESNVYRDINAACANNPDMLEYYDFKDYMTLHNKLVNGKPPVGSTNLHAWYLFCDAYLKNIDAFREAQIFSLDSTECFLESKVDITFCMFFIPEDTDCRSLIYVKLPVNCPKEGLRHDEQSQEYTDSYEGTEKGVTTQKEKPAVEGGKRERKHHFRWWLNKKENAKPREHPADINEEAQDFITKQHASFN